MCREGDGKEWEQKTGGRGSRQARVSSGTAWGAWEDQIDQITLCHSIKVLTLLDAPMLRDMKVTSPASHGTRRLPDPRPKPQTRGKLKTRQRHTFRYTNACAEPLSLYCQALTGAPRPEAADLKSQGVHDSKNRRSGGRRCA